jgi:hypothetical protein
MKSTEPKSSTTAQRPKEATGNTFFSKGEGEALGLENEPVQAFFSEPKSSSPFFDAIQPKLKVHPSNDVYEKEADAAAERVVQDMHHTPTVQRQEKAVEGLQTKPLAESLTPVQTKRAFDSPTPLELNNADNENERPLQTKADGETESASSALESQLQSSKGQGSPLPEQTKSSMESGFGADFSGVNVHTGSQAADMNKQLGAKAFTHGGDIYFNEGEYQPGTTSGDQLLAHELTHTVQQGAAKTGKGSVQKKGNNQDQKSIVTQLASLSESALQNNPQINEIAEVQNAEKNESIEKGDSFPSGEGNAATENPNSNKKVIQRAGGINDVVAKTFEHRQKGNINTDNKELIIPTLKIPNFKIASTKTPLTLAKGERNTNQAQVWDQYIKTNFNVQKLDTKLAEGGAPKLSNPANQSVYVLKLKGTSGNQANYVIGDKDTVKERIARPYWDENGNRQFYHVDHMHEIQLGGEDVIANMWLLEDKANMSSGRNIKKEKDDKIKDLLEAASKPGDKQVWKKEPNIETIKNQYKISFKNVVGDLAITGNPKKIYTKEDIISGKSLKGLETLTSNEINRLGLLRDDVLTLFTNRSGGAMYKIENWDKNAGQKTINLGLGVNIDVNRIEYNEQSGTGKIHGMLFRRSNKVKKYVKESEYSFDIRPLQGIPHTGYIERSSVLRELNAELEAVGLSPINLQEASLEPEKGIIGRGAAPV